MSFLKTKKFWIPFSVVGVGIVAIGTSVGLHQKHQNAINIYEGNSRGEIRTKLRNALNTISANDIRVNLNTSGINRKSLTQTISDSGLYAFNVQANQLGLDSNVSVPSGIQIGLKLNKEKNTLQTLNNGVLNIKLIATTPFSNQIETRDLALNTFKKADEKLSSLLTESGEESVLEIKQNNGSAKYQTIEQLNGEVSITNGGNNASMTKISGLTALLKGSNATPENQSNNNISIEGQVKLDSIVKHDSTTYFYLTSANENEWLKLVETNGNNNKQALFKKIKITHLAASEIIVVPNGYTAKETKEFSDKLRTSLNNNNNLSIKVPANGMQSSSVNAAIKPYFVQSPTQSETLTVAVQVVFGSGANAKVYDTNRSSDTAVLKDAGFKFNIYSKKLMQTKKDLASTDINGDMKKLEQFYKDTNFSTPVMKPTPQQMFKCEALTLNGLNATLKIKTNMTGRTARTGGNQNIQNWLLLADYSYAGVNNGEKVLFTPTLSVVHLEKTLVYMNGASRK